MKLTPHTLILLTAFGLAAFSLKAQAGPLQDLDTNLDGQITRAEAEAGRTARFSTADANGDGLLSLEEFTAAANAREDERKARRYERAFDRLDSDGDGRITQAEMDTRGTPRFDRLDANGDNVVTADEMQAGKQRMKDKRPPRPPRQSDR